MLLRPTQKSLPWLGVRTDLSTCVLGVKPLKPGFKEVLIKPSFGSLKYVRGIYPTPLGDIVIEAENKNGDIKTDIKAPDEIKIITK